MKIPFLSFSRRNKEVRDLILNAFVEFYDSEWYILGKSVKKFEEEYAVFNNVKHTIGVSNGLDALHLCLRALKIGQGDEVIVPSNTFIATALAVSYVGAIPVFVEPCIDTYNINPDLIESAITPNTKAIIPVHLYGQACDMDSINHIAKKHNLYIIEDNAQAQGAEWNGLKTGSIGDMSGVSFYPGKNLGALGDAGAITTNNDHLANIVRTLRNYGSSQKYYNEVMGYNNRMDECQASFLSIFLKHLKNWTNERRQIADWYQDHLKGLDEISLPITHSKASHVYHLFVIRTRLRDSLQKYLQEHEIGTLIHYPIPPHLQKCYHKLGHKKGDFPISEELSQNLLSLPLWIGMSEDEVVTVSHKIKEFYT